MKTVLDEYGQAIFYAIVGMIALIIFILGISRITATDPVPYKQSVYNADVYDDEQAPVIRLKYNMVEAEVGESGYATEAQILSTLQDKEVYCVTINGVETSPADNSDLTVTVRGSVDTSHEGTYNISLVASNKTITNTAGVTVCVLKEKTHSY